MTMTPYAKALAENPLTPEALERAAKALALACNGGLWERDYTEAQKQIWRDVAQP